MEGYSEKNDIKEGAGTGANEMIAVLPPMVLGDELFRQLICLPPYDHGEIVKMSQTERLVKLDTLYSVYLPSAMAGEIYSKIYLATLRSLQKKNRQDILRMQSQNFKVIRGGEAITGDGGIIGGSDSFLIIGKSGTGKSLAVQKAVSLATGNRIIETERPMRKIIPALTVQTPFDCSIKGLLLEVFRKVDELLGTDYLKSAVRSGATTDMLIGSLSQVCINHIALLILDEIQNVVFHKAGRQLVSMLTQLINNTGIAICMVGTPEAEPFFESVEYLARRSVGLKYTETPCDDFFKELTRAVFDYQYVKNRTELDKELLLWIYEHTAGIPANLITLLYSAQEGAILSGKEVLNKETLTEAYISRMGTLHGHIAMSMADMRQRSGSVTEETVEPDAKTPENPPQTDLQTRGNANGKKFDAENRAFDPAKSMLSDDGIFKLTKRMKKAGRKTEEIMEKIKLMMPVIEVEGKPWQ